jgi:hypothetical protein
MTRKPIYNDDATKRIISGPNGVWYFQKKVEEKGTKDRDCWDTEFALDNLTKARSLLS